MGDLNGDGKMDVIGRWLETGYWYAGKSDGATFVTSFWSNWAANVTWADVRLADFNGDGKADLIGRIATGSPGGGQWWGNFSNASGSAGIVSYVGAWGATSWVDVVVGDFNSDGKPDIAGRTASGQWWVSQIVNGVFTNTGLWETWSPIAWVDVRANRFATK